MAKKSQFGNRKSALWKIKFVAKQIVNLFFVAENR